MTVSVDYKPTVFTVSGGTTVFNYPWDTLDSDYIEVYVYSNGSRSKKVRGTDYTVDLSRKAVSFISGKAPADGTQVLIARATPRKQTGDLVSGAAYNPEQFESMLDSQAMISQEIGNKADRSIAFDARIPSEDTPDPVNLSVNDRKSKLLGFDEKGNFVADIPSDDHTTASGEAKAAAAEAKKSEVAAAASASLATSSAAAAAQSESDADLEKVKAQQARDESVKAASDAKAELPKVTAEGTKQLGIVTGEGNTQVARVKAEGDTQDARLVATGDAQNTRLETTGDTKIQEIKTEASKYRAEDYIRGIISSFEDPLTDFEVHLDTPGLTEPDDVIWLNDGIPVAVQDQKTRFKRYRHKFTFNPSEIISEATTGSGSFDMSPNILYKVGNKYGYFTGTGTFTGDWGLFDYTYTVDAHTGTQMPTDTPSIDDELPSGDFHVTTVKSDRKTAALVLTTSDSNNAEEVDVYVKHDGKFKYYRSVSGMQHGVEVSKGFTIGYATDEVKLVTRKGTGPLSTEFVSIALLTIPDDISDEYFVLQAADRYIGSVKARTYINASEANVNQPLTMGAHFTDALFQAFCNATAGYLEVVEKTMWAVQYNGYGGSQVAEGMDFPNSDINNYEQVPAKYAHKDHVDELTLANLSDAFNHRPNHIRLVDFHRDGDRVDIEMSSGMDGDLRYIINNNTADGVRTTRSGETIKWSYHNTTVGLTVEGIKVSTDVAAVSNGAIGSFKINNSSQTFSESNSTILNLDEYATTFHPLKTPLKLTSGNLNEFLLTTGVDGFNATEIHIVMSTAHNETIAVKIPNTPHARTLRVGVPTEPNGVIRYNPGVPNPSVRRADLENHVGEVITTATEFSDGSTSVQAGDSVPIKNCFTNLTTFEPYKRTLSTTDATLGHQFHADLPIGQSHVAFAYATVLDGDLGMDFERESVYSNGRLVEGIYRKGKDLMFVKEFQGRGRGTYTQDMPVQNKVEKISLGFNTKGIEYLGFDTKSKRPDFAYGTHRYRFGDIVIKITGTFGSAPEQTEPFNDTNIFTIGETNGRNTVEFELPDGIKLRGMSFGNQYNSGYLGSNGKSNLPNAQVKELKVSGLTTDGHVNLVENKKGALNLENDEVRLFAWDNDHYSTTEAEFVKTGGEYACISNLVLYLEKPSTTGTKHLSDSSVSQNQTKTDAFKEIAIADKCIVMKNTTMIDALANPPAYFEDEPKDIPFGTPGLDEHGKVNPEQTYTELLEGSNVQFFTGNLPSGVSESDVHSLTMQRVHGGVEPKFVPQWLTNELTTLNKQRDRKVKFIPTKDVTSFQIGVADAEYAFGFTGTVRITGGTGASAVDFSKAVSDEARTTDVTRWTTVNNVTLKAGVEYTLWDDQPEGWRFAKLKTGTDEKVFNVTQGESTWRKSLKTIPQPVPIRVPQALADFFGGGGGVKTLTSGESYKFRDMVLYFNHLYFVTEDFTFDGSDLSKLELLHDLSVKGDIKGGLNRYWRLRLLNATSGTHYPRVSRVLFKHGSSSTPVTIYQTDNCRDVGVIPSNGTTYNFDFRTPKAVDGFQMYVVYSGGTNYGGTFILESSSDNSNWKTSFSGTISTVGCGLKTFTPENT